MGKQRWQAFRRRPISLIVCGLVTLATGLLAELHYYAMRPMSLYGDGRVTYDVPGLARERRQEETGVFQIYFTGCGGDIGMGKYNDGTLSTRQELAGRLHDAMARSTASIRDRHPVTPIRWGRAEVRLSLRREPEFSEDVCRQIVRDAKARSGERIKTAMILAFTERARKGHAVDVSCLSIGPARILNCSGELFVEYQLFAQKIAPPNTFVAVAAYGDCGMWYVGTNDANADRGGYEQNWSFIQPSEEIVKKAIAQALAESES